MCKEKLDQKLSQQFLQNSPKMGFSILRGTTVESLDPAHLLSGFKESTCDFPTLLHFSAHHGLERLTSVLLECPGAALANQMKNCSDMSPAELAQVNGNIDLSNRLQHFQVHINSLSSLKRKFYPLTPKFYLSIILYIF